MKASKAGATYGYITLVTTTGANWDTVNESDRYGAAAEGDKLTSGVAASMTLYEHNVNASAAKSWALDPGTYTITADFETMTITATKGNIPQVANGALAVTEVTVNPGRDASIEISIAQADKVMKALQFDLELPTGITAGAPLISRTMGNHTVQSSTVNGKLRVVIYSQTNEAFTSENGALVYIPISVAASVAAGSYDVVLTDIVFADDDLLAVNIKKITAEGVITVEIASDYEITLNKTVLALAHGATATLTAKVTPHDGTDETITWISSNESVATVTSDGFVTAVSNGEAIISATCKGAIAKCTVYVGKEGQTITWSQVIPKLAMDESVTLTDATATSRLPVTFAITAGAGYAKLTEKEGVWTLTATAPGVVTVTASQEGNESFAPAESVSKTVTIWLGYYEGDANGDSEVTLADAVITINEILGKNPEGFNSTAADINGDDSINVVDVALIVQKVLDAEGATLGTSAFRLAGNVASPEQFAVAADNAGLRVTFSNQEQYVATLFEVTLPEGVEINEASINGSDHAVMTRRLNDTTTRVAVYSLANSTFAPAGYVRLALSAADGTEVMISNASIVKTDGVHTEESNANGTDIHITGISDLNADSADGAVYYNLQGVRTAHPGAGVYVRVAGGKATKVLVK